MAGKKRTEIMIETHRVVTVRRVRRKRPLCARCGGKIGMVTAEEATALTGISRRTIMENIAVDRMHWTKTADGVLWVCLKSSPEEDGS